MEGERAVSRAAVPFPLASGRYEVGPAMRRFGQAGQGFPAEEGHFRFDDQLAPTLAAKLEVLRRAPEECHLRAGDSPELVLALRETFALLAAEHPHVASVDEDGVTLYHLGLRLDGWSQVVAIGPGWSSLGPVAASLRAYLAGFQGVALVAEALGLSVQEDLAVVRGPEGESGDVLEWLHVCLPSGWAPAEKIGRSFGVVHEPVAGSGALIASQGQIIRAMIHAGPFVRYVWGIHRDAELCHNPRLHRSAPWVAGGSPSELAHQAWFRVERQTTRGFPGLNRALFTIRYWVEPLAETAADPWRRERLASALRGMNEEELGYKGLVGARDGLVAWLESLES